MKLTKIAILALQGLGKDVKERIATAAGVGNVSTVYGWIARNEPNSSLTKASVVQLISTETGLTQDQILEESEKEVQDTATETVPQTVVR